VCAHQEKPFPFIGNVLSLPQMYDAVAAAGVPVVLDGTGGDEVFGGYWDRYWHFAAREAAATGDGGWLRAQHAAMGANGSAEALLSGSSSPPPYFAKFCSARVMAAANSDPLADLDAPFTDALLIDATRGRMQEWLWQNDRSAMLASTENRSPLLDYRLLTFARTGYARKFVGPWNKHELRLLFDAFTPLPTQWRRQKQGFRWVYGRFLRNNRAKVSELIAGSKLVRERVDLAAYLPVLSTSEDCLESDLTQRLLCIAGIEQAMDVVA
jgi:asparagine synthase (glutamine-hydrolysing)